MEEFGKDLIFSNMKEAVGTLCDLNKNASSESVRLNAAKEILNFINNHIEDDFDNGKFMELVKALEEIK